MKQTIKTANYNAVVEIPYERLAKQSSCTPLNSYLPQENLAQTKTIVVPHCNGCCHPTPKNNPITMEMIQQLQAAFDSDMKQKDQKIRSLEGEGETLISQLAQSKHELEKFQRVAENDKTKYESIIKCREDEVKALRKQVEQAQLQKERILRTKIIQFQNNQLQYHRTEAEKLAKLQAEADKKLKDQILSVNLSFQQERFKLKEEVTQLRLSSQYQKAAYQRQNERLAKQMGEDQLKIQRLQKCLQQLQQKQTNYLSTISKKQSEYLGLLKESQDQRQNIQTLELNIREHLDNIKMLKDKLAQSDLSYSELNKKYTDIGVNYDSTLGISKQYEFQLKEVQTQKLSLLQRIDQLELCIKQKQEALLNFEKNGPKVYEVKIQKVIDRSQYIQSLQSELQNFRRAHLDLEARIKELQISITNKNKELSDSLAKSVELERVIKNLRLYIEEKQRSFAWIVEREISKDIQINKNQINKTYKVYPSEVKHITDLKHKQMFPEYERQRVQQNIVIEHPVNIAYRMAESFDKGQDSTAILKQLEDSGQMLKNVIIKEVSASEKVGTNGQQIKFQEVFDDLRVHGEDD